MSISVEVKVDSGGVDWRPHTFLIVTDEAVLKHSMTFIQRMVV